MKMLVPMGEGINYMKNIAGENKRHHLLMIQGIIDRMGRNSFSLKEWSIGIMIAIFAFAGKNTHKAVIITIIPLVVFWFLDAYYLMLERKFRALYDDVRLNDEDKIDFSMNFNNIKLDMKDVKKYSYFNILISKTVMPFYTICIITSIIIYFIEF